MKTKTILLLSGLFISATILSARKIPKDKHFYAITLSPGINQDDVSLIVQRKYKMLQNFSGFSVITFYSGKKQEQIEKELSDFGEVEILKTESLYLLNFFKKRS